MNHSKMCSNPIQGLQVADTGNMTAQYGKSSCLITAGKVMMDMVIHAQFGIESNYYSCMISLKQKNA